MVTQAQLLELGWDRYALRRRIEAGYLFPLHWEVFAVGHRVVTLHGRFMAAVCACGLGSGGSHRTGGHLHDLRQCRTRIEVTQPRGRAGHRGITIYRSRMMDPVDFTEVDGIHVTTVTRTLLDLAVASTTTAPDATANATRPPMLT